MNFHFPTAKVTGVFGSTLSFLHYLSPILPKFRFNHLTTESFSFCLKWISWPFCFLIRCTLFVISVRCVQWVLSWCADAESLGAVSLTFCKLSKIISRKYTMSEIIFMVRISSLNFLRGHTYKISAWNSHKKYDFWNPQISREYFGELAKH